MAGFDVEGAKKAGYSDAEIASHLAQERGFDLEAARKAGYSDSDVLSHLMSQPAMKPQDQATAALSSVAGGLTQNFGDEAKAYIQSSMPGAVEAANTKLFNVPDWFPSFLKAPQQPAPPVGNYEQELARNRAQNAANESAYPITTGAGNIAGNIAGTLAVAPSGLFSPAASFTGNVAKGIGTGAVLGAIPGFGSGEGGFENRAASAVIPAAAGAGLGGFAPFAGVGARALAESAPGRFVSGNVIDPMVRLLTTGSTAAPEAAPSVVRSGAMNRIVNAAQREGLNPAEAQASLDRLGASAMPADINARLRGLAETAVTMQGQSQGLAERNFAERYLGAPDRMTAAIEGPQPLQSAHALRGEGGVYERNITDVGRTAYQGDMVAAGANQSPELQQMMSNPWVQDALKKVEATDVASRIGRPNAPPVSEIEKLNEVQKMIRAKGFIKGTAIPGPNMKPYRNVATDFSQTLRNDNPALDSAMRQYSEAKSLPEFFDRGAGAFGRSSAATEAGIEKSAPSVADMLMGATPSQAEAGRAGILNAARMRAQESPQSALALAKDISGPVLPPGAAPLVSTTPIQQKIAALAEDRAGEMLRQSRAEQTFQNTAKQVSQGSPSARRLAQMEEESAAAPNVQLRANSGGLTTRAIESVGKLLRNISSPNEEIRNEIGRIMLNPNAPQNREFMQRLAEALQQRAASGGVRAGAIAAGANQINRGLQ